MYTAKTWGYDMSLALHHAHINTVSWLLAEWAHAIDDDRVERIAELMRNDGRYTVASRFNVDHGLPLAIVDTHNAAQLRDRIRSMRVANIYQPQHYRHLVSAIQVLAQTEDGLLQVRSSFTVFRTLVTTGDTMFFAGGRCDDLIDVSGAEPRFAHRHMIFDSRAVETLMIIPI